MFGVCLPMSDGFQTFPVGNGDADFISRGLDTEIAGLLGGEFDHAFGHFGIAIVAFRSDGSKNDRVVGRGWCFCNHGLDILIFRYLEAKISHSLLLFQLLKIASHANFARFRHDF